MPARDALLVPRAVQRTLPRVLLRGFRQGREPAQQGDGLQALHGTQVQPGACGVPLHGHRGTVRPVLPLSCAVHFRDDTLAAPPARSELILLDTTPEM